MSSQSNALVPKRAKTVINLKAKAVERESREKLSGFEKELQKMKRDLKREETEENRLKRERDEVTKKLRRKKDDGTFRLSMTGFWVVLGLVGFEATGGLKFTSMIETKSYETTL